MTGLREVTQKWFKDPNRKQYAEVIESGNWENDIGCVFCNRTSLTKLVGVCLFEKPETNGIKFVFYTLCKLCAPKNPTEQFFSVIESKLRTLWFQKNGTQLGRALQWGELKGGK